ncbi:hypothetical protein PAXINDRAFT_17412 [Paxillus involutus ATCC 200175]|uniref:Uncharacterized protein n=1 Tax=Paxillus involutus ATCC 200175 TaxID=664439 RepID=A0A0C9TNW0_PAXIN|nr:hypothetical protein PAXINDRAFT_17412 [Paxillus involutus ATCC 200175]
MDVDTRPAEDASQSLPPPLSPKALGTASEETHTDVDTRPTEDAPQSLPPPLSPTAPETASEEICTDVDTRPAEDARRTLPPPLSPTAPETASEEIRTDPDTRPAEDARRPPSPQLPIPVPATTTSNGAAISWLISQFPSTYFIAEHPLEYNGTITRHGTLEVPARTQSRLRLWILRNPTQPLRHFLLFCLSCGLQWRVVEPSPLQDIPLTPVANIIPLLQHSSNVAIDYERNLRTLFARPHSHQLLARGGLLWRLATHYSGLLGLDDTLVAYNLSGPNGRTNHAELTTDEIDALLGRSPSTSLWPPLEVWNNSDRWNGQWSPSNEEWFLTHAEVIRSDIKKAFKSRRVWLRNHFQRCRRADIDNNGSELYARNICTQHDILFNVFPSGRLTELRN